MGYNSAHVIIGDESERSAMSRRSRRCFAEQFGNIGEHRRWIGDESPNHRRYYHIEYASFRRCHTSIADVSPMSRLCIWVIFNLGVPRRMFADCSALFSDISPMVFDVETSGENFNACIEIWKFGDYSRTSPIIRRTTGALVQEH